MSMQSEATDIYGYWREELANPGCNDRDTNRADICGFYRIRGADTKPDYPVAIWDSGEGVVAKVSRQSSVMEYGTERFYDFLGSGWVKCAAVEHDAYNHALEHGVWPDDLKRSRKPDIGDNSSEAPRDAFEALTIEYDQEAEQARDFLKTPIKDQERADMAAIWSKKLSGIAKKATDLHKVEKQPHLDASRSVDDKWRDLKDGPKALSTDIKRALDSFLQEQARIERERQRVAQAEADRLAKEAAEAATRASDAEAERLAEKAAEAAKAVAPVQNTSAGRTGAKVALRTFTFAEITEYDKLLTALKDRDEIKEVVQSLANRAAKSGVDLPGMEIKKEQRAA